MASLYQNNAPGRPPGGGPPGGGFRPPQHPPPGAYNPSLYAPPPGTYNPNHYPGGAIQQPIPMAPPSIPPPPYGTAPPPPPHSGPPPPPPPQYHQSASHYAPHHQAGQHHSQSQHSQSQHGRPHGSGNHHQQNLGHGNHHGHSHGHGHTGSRPNNMAGSSSHSHSHFRQGASHVSGGAAAAQLNKGSSGQEARGGSIGAGNQGRKPETEEERRARKKREYERMKAEERHSRTAQGAGGSSRPGHVNGTRDHHRADRRSTAAADKIENRLKRPSTFLCKIRFRNELPDPVAQPKLMSINNDRDQYTKYQFTTLEKNYKYKLHVEPDLGIPLDLLDLSAYNAPQVRPPLDPEDAELLKDDEIQVGSTIKTKARPTDKGVAWLVKTQYISPLSLDPAKQAITEKQAKELKEQREGEMLMRENTREQQLLAIEESFRVAKQRPVHQTKPDLEPVEILPLLPDFDRWGDQFVHMIFDAEPTGEGENLTAPMNNEKRDDLEARAIVKSYTIPNQREGKPEKFVAYMVPKMEEIDKDIYDDDEDVGYTWIREYHWDLRTDPSNSTYVFCFGEDGVTYVPLHTKLTLQKKKAMEGRPKDEDFDNQFPVPSGITVRRRDLTEEEANQKEDRRLALLEEGLSENGGALVKRKRSHEPLMIMSSKRTVVHEEAVLNREDSDDDEQTSV